MGTGFLFFWLLFWAIVGAAVGQAIGRSKGRPEAGLWWGLLLGVIGWIVVAIGPDLRPKCPECGGTVVAGARRCKNCGSDIERAPEAKLASV
jgi:hypothetical protein